MYAIEKKRYIRENPWDLPLEKRIRKLLEYKKQEQLIVAYLYELADTSTFRYRVYNMCQALESGIEWKGVYFFSKELEIVKEYLDYIDVIVIARYRWTLELEKLIIYAKRKGIHIGFDVDDMVYTTKYISLITNTLSVCMSEERYDYWFAYTARLASTLQLCDFVITTNGYLANFLSADTGKKCYIAKNFYNRMQAEVSQSYYQQKKEKKQQSKFVIGYFSGTPSHINDFLCVEPELLRLLDEYDDIVLRIVGFMELPISLQEYCERGRIERIPLQNFIELQALMAEVDVSIVPLVNNEFSNCKSELKFYEAGIVGTITCATPSYTFKNVIENEKNGYLCNLGEWYSTIKGIYNLEEDARLKIGEAAREVSIKNYAYFNQTDYLENMFTEIKGEKTDGQ